MIEPPEPKLFWIVKEDSDTKWVPTTREEDLVFKELVFLFSVVVTVKYFCCRLFY